MSPLTNHTTDLQLSLALKEAGYEQGKSTFVWEKPASTNQWHLVLRENRVKETGAIDAYLASELMERMPDYIYVQRRRDTWFCCLQDADLDTIPTETAETLPNALGKLALYLVKEGMMKF